MSTPWPPPPEPPAGPYPNSPYQQGQPPPPPGPADQPPSQQWPATGAPTQQWPQHQQWAPQSAPQNNPGTWALVLGLLSVLCFSILAGIPAIILGVKGRRLAAERRATNGGMATAGLVLGVVSCVLLPVGIAALIVAAPERNSFATDVQPLPLPSLSEPAAPAPEGPESSGLPEGVYAFGDLLEFTNGSTLTTTGPEKFTRSDISAGGEGFSTAVRFKVTFTNGTNEIFDPSPTLARLSSGETEGEMIFQQGLAMPLNPVLPGKKVTWVMGFGTNDPTKATLTIRMGGIRDGYDEVIFTNEAG